MVVVEIHYYPKDNNNSMMKMMMMMRNNIKIMQLVQKPIDETWKQNQVKVQVQMMMIIIITRSQNKLVENILVVQRMPHLM